MVGKYNQINLGLLSDSAHSAVFKRWIIGATDHGVCRGVVKSYDETLAGPSDRPWKIFWDDGTKSSFNASDMLNYCINHTHGTTVTQVIESEWDMSESDDELISGDPTTAACDNKRAIFDEAEMTFYTTKDNDTWKTVCNELGIAHGQRKLYYQWLSENHGYGHQRSTRQPFKFVNPYGQSTKTHKFPAGVPFPHPCGGEWDSMTLPDEGGQVAIMHMVNQIVNEQIMLLKARSYDFPKEVEAGAFGDIETEDINAALGCIDDWIDLPDPKDWDECMSRPDAVLFRLALAVETAAFKDLQVMSFHVHLASFIYSAHILRVRRYTRGRHPGHHTLRGAAL
eukprot:COSAG01_NODE_12115_length_1798_cov_12.474985_2_plen_339_part_00